MRQVLEECRWLYNNLLEQRKAVWDADQKSLRLYDQIKMLPSLKKDRASLAAPHSQVLQNVAVRIDLAFKSFFRRVKMDEKPGYPRFRGKGWYDSFTYPQSGFAINNGSITLSKIGTIEAALHRLIEGRIKTCCIKRTSTGKWFACFSCQDAPNKPLPESSEAVGIDVGLTAFATLSNKQKIKNPRFFHQDEKDLAKAQRRLSKEIKGSSARAKRRKVVSRIYERIANRRRDFAHQQSRRIINQYGIIAVEDLSINQMLHDNCHARSIADAAWGQFAAFLSYKAESAGRKFVAVNPAYTTQDCSSCGHRQPMPLPKRIFRCPCCGLVLNRDHNAALNILAVGLDSLGLVPRSPQLREQPHHILQLMVSLRG